MNGTRLDFGIDVDERRIKQAPLSVGSSSKYKDCIALTDLQRIQAVIKVTTPIFQGTR